MKTNEEIAYDAAWQIYEEIGLSKHSVERVKEIIVGSLMKKKSIDIEKAWRWIELYRHMDFHWTMEQMKNHFIKTMEE